MMSLDANLLIFTRNDLTLHFNLLTGSIKEVNGMVWCGHQYKDGYLTGSEDGIIRGYDEEGMIGQTRSYDAKRVLSLTVNESVFYASYLNGIIRAFDSRFQNTLTMSVKDKGQKCLPWAIKYYESELLAGCSDGTVRVFETTHGTGIKTIKTHQADVTCLLTTDKGVDL